MKRAFTLAAVTLLAGTVAAIPDGPGWTVKSTVLRLVNRSHGGVNVRLSPHLDISQSTGKAMYAQLMAAQHIKTPLQSWVSVLALMHTNYETLSYIVSRPDVTRYVELYETHPTRITLTRLQHPGRQLWRRPVVKLSESDRRDQLSRLQQHESLH
jgi:hypothetical protein